MISKACIDLIKEFEGFREEAYLCPAGRWTIGYGTTRLWNGARIKAGDKITESKAENELLKSIEQLQRYITDTINVKFNENQLSALTSFVYNIGQGNFSSSTLSIYLHAENWEKAADQFPLWKYITNPRTGKKTVSEGLIKRREKERDLFLLPI